MIVAFGIGAAAFAASSINFSRRGIAAPAYPLNTVLQSRHASCASEKSLGSASKRVSTPTPVACVPRSGAPRTSFLSAASSFAACCLFCFSSFCNSVFCLQRSRELLMHCSHGFFGHLGRLGTRCHSIDSDPPTSTEFQLRGVQASAQAPPTSADLPLLHGFQRRGVQTVTPASAPTINESLR